MSGAAPSPAALSPTVALLTLARGAELRVARLLEPHGLTLRRYGILQHIGETPGLTVGALARRADVTAQAVQAALRSLVEAGLVRSVGNTGAHAPQLSVTAAGATLVTELAAAIAAIDDELFGADRELLARSLLDATAPPAIPATQADLQGDL